MFSSINDNTWWRDMKTQKDGEMLEVVLLSETKCECECECERM